MSTFSENDDDLFEYEYDEKTTNTYSDLPTDKVKDFNEKINLALEDNDSDITSGVIHPEKVQFALAYQKALHHFTEVVNYESLAKTFTVTLNILTNGDFILMQKFYALEMLIVKKMIILDISHKAFYDKDNVNSQFISELATFLKINIDEFYIENFFKSSIEMCEFSLKLNRAEYLTLSKKLGLPVQQALFNDYSSLEEKDMKVFFEDFRSQQQIDIFKIMVENNLLEEIKNICGLEAKVDFNEV